MSNPHIPYFEFYPADFMNGVRGLTPAEVGIYMMVLCRIYEESSALEYHPLRLATYCGIKVPVLEKIIEKLVDLDKLQLSDGVLSQRRAGEEIAKRESKLKSASRAGKASAQKRQQNQHQDATPVQPTFNHTDTDTDTDTDKKELDTYVSLSDLGFDLFNEIAERAGWPKCQSKNKSRVSSMLARLKDAGGLDGWRAALEKAEASDFLCNRSSKPFTATIDFLLKSGSFTKLMEGNYDNRESNGRGTTGPNSERAFGTMARAFEEAGSAGSIDGGSTGGRNLRVVGPGRS